MQIMRVDQETVSPKFCFFLMAWLYSIGATERLQKATTGIRNLDFSTYMQMQVLIPPLHEQRRIAKILSSVDEAIAATRAVIEQTRNVRSEILSTSFPEDQAAGPSKADDTFEGWSIEPASSICECIIDCKNRTPPVTGDGYAVVRTPNVRNGRFRYEGLQFTDKQSFQEWTAKGMPRAGDILFTREAPYGEVCMAPAMAFCLGQRMMFLRPDTSRVSSDFLLYALQSGPVKKEMFRRAGGSTVGHLRVGDVRELPIPVAPRDVQLRLTSTLRSLDEALDSNEEALSRLKDCKSALMSDLLTGRKRVTDALPMAAE
jgi:type I restriction enzyme S subunit